MTRFQRLIGILPLLAAIMFIGAVDISGALYRSVLSATNTGSDATGVGVPFKYSGEALIDQNFIDPDGLNAVVVGVDGEAAASMPPSIQVDMLYCLQFIAASTTYNDESTDCQNATTGDVAFFAAVPLTNDAFYFGLDEPGRIIEFQNTLGFDWDGSLSWEYWNGDAAIWDFLQDVEDTSNSFANTGFNTVSYTLPSNWAEASVDAKTAWWVRARLTNSPTVLVQGNGAQVWWETGLLWAFYETLQQNEQINYTYYLGGPSMVENHQVFPGDDGVVTNDAAVLELGQDYLVRWIGYLDTASDTADKNMVNKSGAFRLYLSGEQELTLALNGVDTITIPSIPSGTYTVDVLSNIDTVILSLDGASDFSGSATSVSVTDNGNAWNWVTNGMMVYFDQITIVFASTQGLGIQEDWIGGTEIDTGTMLNYNWRVTPSSRCTVDTISVGGNDIISYDETLDELLIADTNTIRRYNPATCTQIGTIPFTSVFDVGAAYPNYWVVTGGSTVTEIDGAGATVSSCTVSGGSLFGIGYATPSGDVYVADWQDDLIKQINPSTCATIRSFDIFPSVEESAWTLTTFAQYGVDIYQDNRLFGTATARVNNSGTTNRMRTFCWEMDASTGEHVRSWAHNERYHTSAPSCSSAGSGEVVLTSSLRNGGTCCGNDPSPGESDGRLVFFSETSGKKGITLDLNAGSVSPQSWSDYGSNIGTASHTAIASDTVDGNLAWLSIPFGTAADYGIYQRFAATPGQAWSASGQFKMVKDPTFSNSVTREVSLRWLDASFVEISRPQTTSSVSSAGAYTTITLNNQTAPAGTAWVDVQFGWDGVGTATGWWGAFDGAMACVCTSAPTYPDAQNILTDPGMERWYDTSGTYTSPNLNFSTVTNVNSSKIQWVETVGSGQTVLAEVSINGGVDWLTATNGAAIPYATVGSDISAVNFQVRFTLTDDDGFDSPDVSDLTLFVQDDADAVLEYRLQQMIGIIIPDTAGVSNESGRLNYPLFQWSAVNAIQGALGSTQIVTSRRSDALTPDVLDEVAGPIVTGNFQGNGVPLHSLWVALSGITGGEIPVLVYWLMFALVVVLTAGILTMLFTQSIPWTAAVMGMFILGFVNFGNDTDGQGLLPMWIFFFSGIMLFAVSVFSKIKAM